FAFMERMVTDPDVSKVAVICDKSYAERAKSRKGGVGAESQIMSAELYGKVDQTKFVAIAREKDEHGRAYMPAFFTSRIYIDLSQEADFARGFEQLIRWCFDKPLYVEPELGEPPAFLDEQSAPFLSRAAPVERILREAVPNEKSVAAATVSFLREISTTSVDFQAKFEADQPHDDAVFRTIEGLAPLLSQLLRVLDGATQTDEQERVQTSFHDYLEHIIPHLGIGPTECSPDPTKFYANFALVGFLAILLRNRKFQAARHFLDSPYIKENYGGMTGKSVTYEIFRAYLPSIEARNKRLGLNRLSLHADLIKQVCDTIGFKFREYIEADFLLYLRGAAHGFEKDGSWPYRGWWPTSALYVSDIDGALPIFVRAESPSHRDELLELVGVRSKGEFEALVEGFRSGVLKAPEWSGAFSRLDVPALMNAEKILATYQ
ncbi:MAG: hypothetical protein ABI557_16925, partial [Aureliella sp.]